MKRPEKLNSKFVSPHMILTPTAAFLNRRTHSMGVPQSPRATGARLEAKLPTDLCWSSSTSCTLVPLNNLAEIINSNKKTGLDCSVVELVKLAPTPLKEPSVSKQHTKKQARRLRKRNQAREGAMLPPASPGQISDLTQDGVIPEEMFLKESTISPPGPSSSNDEHTLDMLEHVLANCEQFQAMRELVIYFKNEIDALAKELTGVNSSPNEVVKATLIRLTDFSRTIDDLETSIVRCIFELYEQSEREDAGQVISSKLVDNQKLVAEFWEKVNPLRTGLATYTELCQLTRQYQSVLDRYETLEKDIERCIKASKKWGEIIQVLPGASSAQNKIAIAENEEYNNALKQAQRRIADQLKSIQNDFLRAPMIDVRFIEQCRSNLLITNLDIQKGLREVQSRTAALEGDCEKYGNRIENQPTILRKNSSKKVESHARKPDRSTLAKANKPNKPNKKHRKRKTLEVSQSPVDQPPLKFNVTAVSNPPSNALPLSGEASEGLKRTVYEMFDW